MNRILAIAAVTILAGVGCFGIGHFIVDRWFVERTWHRLPPRSSVAWAPAPRRDHCPVDLRTPLLLAELHTGIREARGDLSRYVERVFRCERDPARRAGFLAMVTNQAKVDRLAHRAFDHLAHHLCAEFAELAGVASEAAGNGRFACPEILRLATSHRASQDDHRRVLTSRIAQLSALLESGVTQPDVTVAFCLITAVAASEGVALPDRVREAYVPLVARHCSEVASADAGHAQ